jgi:hypothetical protein
MDYIKSNYNIILTTFFVLGIMFVPVFTTNNNEWKKNTTPKMILPKQASFKRVQN